MDPFASHLPVLVREALAAQGPILELGCGDYSTPVLAAIAAHKGRSLTVYTSNREWATKYDTVANVHLVDWSAMDFTGSWGLVFLDNEETTGDRIRHLPALAFVTPVVVLHDAQASRGHSHWPHMTRRYSIEIDTTHDPGTVVLRTAFRDSRR